MLRYLVAAALLCACQAFAPAPTPRKRQLRKPAMLPDPTLSLALGTDADVRRCSSGDDISLRQAAVVVDGGCCAGAGGLAPMSS